MDITIEQLLAFKGAAVALWALLFFLGERWRPAAPPPWGNGRNLARLARNLGLFALNIPLSVLIVIPLSAWAAVAGPDWRADVAPWWQGGFGLLADLLLLDFLIYWWHRANHEIPFLWRFHEIHHLDGFLDSTSALRFHYGEVFLSALFRSAVILALNIPLSSILIFESLLLAAAIFHHSNLRLPPLPERLLARLVITPSQHWMHHHAVRRDTDSNYGTMLSIWDRLFCTRNPGERRADMPIGVDGEHERTFTTLLLRPFRPTASNRND